MPVMNLPAGNSRDFDVVVIGGAISGEATAEVSSFFLTRVLGLTNFLARTRISKNGLRFWFYSDSDGRLADCTELGGKYLTTVPAQLIDRSVLDEEMLRRAITKGAELIRPAQMKSVALQEGGLQEILLNHEGGEKTIRARWVVVASGPNFRLGQLFWTICDGLWLWLVLEIREGWRSWFRSEEKTAPACEAVASPPFPAPPPRIRDYLTAAPCGGLSNS